MNKTVQNQYGDPVFWEEKYSHQVLTEEGFSAFDMLCPFSALYPLLDGHLNHSKTHHVLVLGVGRSQVIDVMLEKKCFPRITAIDASATLVAKLQSKYEDITGVEVLHMDVRRMGVLADASFSLVLDKACLDCLFCDTDFVAAVYAAYSEIFRVLAPGGLLFSVSGAEPATRVPYMRDQDWHVASYPLLEGESLHLFTATRAVCTEDNAVAGLEGVKNKYQSVASQHQQQDALDRPVVSSVHQRQNKTPRVKQPSSRGTLTVTASLQELRTLIEENTN